MKYKLKTRLFAALALSGVSFYWPASSVEAQQDDFGFIRPAEPARQNEQAVDVPPMNQANPPIVKQAPLTQQLQPSSAVRPPAAMPPVVSSPASRRSSATSAPKPFASSSVFNGTYIAESQGSVRQVSYQEPVRANELPPVVSGLQAQRDVPPIVQSAGVASPRIVQPIEQNELPPILLPVQGSAAPGMSPIITPKASSDQMLRPIQTGYQSGALSNADGSSLSEASEVELAGFGASPLMVQEAPPIIGSIIGEGGTGELPQGSGSRSIGPALNLPGSDSFPRAPLDAGGAAPRSVFEQALPLEQPTTPRDTYFEPTAQQAPVYGGCSTCGANGGSCGCSNGNHSGVSGCSSCGDNGCFDPAAVEGMFNSSGSNAYARRYLIAEALYFDRTDGRINNSNFGSLNDFEAEAGARITFGVRSDSTRGREFQYSGISSVEENRRDLNDAGLIRSLFVPDGGIVAGGGLTTANLSSFFNATDQSQTKETYYHSLEFNRVKWGWDVIKSYFGFRYLYVDDEYSLVSQSPQFLGGPVDTGTFQMDAVNNLFGPHVGGELYYDIGYRWSLSGVSRAGAYINLSRFDTRLTNNGTEFIDVEDTNATIAFSYEASLNAKFRLTRQAQFRVGYNILYLDNLATVSDNLVNNGGGILVSPSLGASISDSGSIFLHGLSVGFELYR